MKSFFKDFKEFIAKGNVIDMAIGVIIGGAFGKIVTSLVDDIIMPLISLATGGLDFSEWKLVLNEAGATLNYGNLISVVLNFLIIALCIFCVLRVVMKAKDKLIKKKEEEEAEEEPAETTEDILAEIRDYLKKDEK